MALNEQGTKGAIALHTKLAVLSARRHTSLAPVMLYSGARNNFIRWLERHGVAVIEQTLPYLDVIDGLVDQGRYSRATVGHWLRTNICLVEQDDPYAFYTDVDVLFRRDPPVDAIRPRFIAAAPEFDRDGANYFNAGVMVMNLPAMRAEYPPFEHFLRANLAEKAWGFNEQDAYNQFYRQRWDRLDPTLNWKPYWGSNPEASIVHFHGPKINTIRAIVNGNWNWEASHHQQIGSLLTAFLPAYREYLAIALEESDGLGDEEVGRIGTLHKQVTDFRPDPDRPTDLSFMKVKMFHE